MSYHFLDDSGVATLWAAIKEKFIDVTKKGAANGVCPLNAYGVIPGEYIPGGGEEDRYVVNVNVDVDGHLRTDIPAADAEELMEIAQHDFPELRLVVTGTLFYKAQFVAKLSSRYMFTFQNGRRYIVYEVNTTNGTISITSEITFVTEEE